MKNNFCKNMVRLAALACSFAILGNITISKLTWRYSPTISQEQTNLHDIQPLNDADTTYRPHKE